MNTTRIYVNKWISKVEGENILRKKNVRVNGVEQKKTIVPRE